ncbi:MULTISPECIES: DUF2190 family protein [Serratia]|jgi:predicted RecA/RadA family phage recombinase|uniref:Uncharacterized conserved protein n=1 Tax=Serratia quinivorans TaxID=137545 RepID=A0A380ARS9_9GAMM|nr:MULTISPECIES: capsid cement protein [Serratia]SUI86318.1 Uncharacterized conserved protein [Serratia quinivorans]AEF46525.1 protein of unknown function UCP030771 [Serratia plymuthica AS9]AEF51477.1 protein of unknown function UCP030771 [Serratia sp. AS12]AEG29185.1 protein of unknown function UCP030771 [Serratia sp. AS13]RYM50976.1 recombinase RecA [Serratia proteamaculans]
MAKNFVQDGNTIAIAATAADIASGDPVVVGDLVAVAITDIPKGRIGDGFTSGVFQLPKLSADVIPAGKKVFIKGGVVQLADVDAVAAGYAWEAAVKDATVVSVKLNG